MRIEINEPQAIWELGQQTEQQDNIYPRKGEADQSDRIFIVASGHSSDGQSSQDIIKNISGYYKRYRSGSGEISDEEIRASIDTCRSKDGKSWPNGISFVMVCLHREGITIVSVGGNCHVYQIRPSAKRVIYENKGNEKATMANPAIYHTSDIEPDDYIYFCTNGMLEGADSAEVGKYFSEPGSDDKKRNILRSSTSGNKGNHAAYFFKIRSIISDDGMELTGRRPIVIPEIKSAKPLSKQYDEDEDDDEEVVKPVKQAEKPAVPTQKAEPVRQQAPKQRPQTKGQPRPISRYEDEQHQTNVKMIVLVVAIVILAVAAGALWYFNSSSSSSLPADTTSIEQPVVRDTTATPATQPSDTAAYIPDSAIAEPERKMPPVKTAPKKTEEQSSSSSIYESPYDDESTTTEPSEKTTESEHKAESAAPKSSSADTPKAPKTEENTSAE